MAILFFFKDTFKVILTLRLEVDLPSGKSLRRYTPTDDLFPHTAFSLHQCILIARMHINLLLRPLRLCDVYYQQLDSVWHHLGHEPLGMSEGEFLDL